MRQPLMIDAGSILLRAVRLRVIGATALLLVLSAVYSPALQGGFLWDDDAHITRPDLRSWSGLPRIWVDVRATSQYYPLLHSAFWLEHRLWGDAVLGYHLTNLFLHGAAAGLLYLLLRRLRVPGAYLAAVIFALHPVHVESVAWITEQKNTLSGVFYLAAALAYLHFDETRHPSAYAIALVLFAFSLLSKTVTSTFPAAMLVVLWWRRGRLSLSRDVLPLLPFFVLGAAAGLFTVWVEHSVIGAQGETWELAPSQRLLLAGRAVWFYLGKLLWPADLVFMYPRWEIDPAVWWQWLYPLTALMALALLWSMRRRWRGPLAGSLFFVGTLFPALGFFNVFPFRYSFVADHFQYLASLGVIVPLAAGMTMIAGWLPSRLRPIAVVLGGTWVVVLAAVTFQQSHLYRDVETLWRATIERNPTCWMAYNNLGTTLHESGRVAEAASMYEKVLQLKPDHGNAHNNLAIALITLNRPDEAIEHFRRALSLIPADPPMYTNLGVALYQTRRFDEAIEAYDQALKLKPNFADAYGRLVLVYDALGRHTEAVAAAEKGLALSRAQGNATLAQFLGSWLRTHAPDRLTAP